MDGRLRNMAGLYITDGDKMLLLYRIGSRVVPPSWCNIGGHFEKDELNDAKACVLREVEEETGITEKDLKDLTLRYVTLIHKNKEIWQNYYFFAGLANKDLQLNSCTEGILQWVEIDKVLEREMPYTAKAVLKHYLSQGMYDDKIYGAAAGDQVIFYELKEF